MQPFEIQLVRDCKGTRIPAGDTVDLHKGSSFLVTQALGGSATLKDQYGLYRIPSDDFNALGEDVAEKLREISRQEPISDEPFSEEQVWSALRQCFDPEIPVNIVDLGLIYDLQYKESGSGKYSVDVKMTLTATGCGMGPTIAADARDKIENLSGVEKANVDIVWDPQWTPHMISEEGRKILGLD